MQPTLSQRDRQVIWHPYTQQKNMADPLPLVRGEGTLLYDETGNAYIDASSSWWVNIHGHGHPYIAERIYRQALQLEHVIFAGYTHEPAITLAERLLPLLPGSFSKVFYSDNGSTAVEVALKMAIQYWGNKGVKRHKFLAFHHSYHGDTFGAMSVSERSVFTAAFSDYLFEVVFIDTPTVENLPTVLQQIRQHASETAAFIYEPLLQGAGGMRMYDAAHLDTILQVCRSENVLCIADEVLTGFGRTGKLFASEYTSHKPDIICLSKGITGGTMALGVTASTERVFDAFLSDDKRKTLFHGHSFTANPLACSAALASLDLLLQPDCQERIAHIARRHTDFLETIRPYPIVRDARALGTVLAFELNTGDDGYTNSIGQQITAAALGAGIYLRPLGNTVYFMPPYCITQKEMDQVYDFLVHCLVRYSGNPVT